MELYKEGISHEIFKQLMDDILFFYKGKLSEAKIKKEDIDVCDKICAIENVDNFIKPIHGLSKHIFAKRDTDEFYYSVGAIIDKELVKKKKKLDIDITDFIYKKCIAFSNNEPEIEVYSSFFEIFGYKDGKEYCAGKNLDYSESAIWKQKKSLKNYNIYLEKKLLNKLEGGWWLYFYKNEGFGKDPSLASAILEVETLKTLKIFNSPSESSINYVGQLDDSLEKISGVVYLKFSPVDSKEARNLRIALHLSEEINLDIAIGQYSNIDRGTHLIRGSVCMKRINDYVIGECEKDNNRLSPKGNKDAIPPEIQRFLADKDLNFNRLPKNQYSLDTFSDWLKIQSVKSTYLIRKKAIENKKLFISCPINSVNPKQFGELSEVVEEITNFFTDKKNNIKFTKVYSIISGLKNQEDKASIPSALEYQKVMRMYNDCSYHIAIWPQDLGPSGILFEIGWAVMNERPVVIFEQIASGAGEHAKSQIPLLILSACDSKKTAIARYHFKDFDKIINILEKNKLKIFPGHLDEEYF